MDIEYKNKRLKKTVKDPRSIVENYGVRAKKIQQRLKDFEAANNLSVFRTLPGNCHELHGNRQGEFAIEVSGNFRMTFIPNHDPVIKNDEGGLDWEYIKNIVIYNIAEDYH
jgi:proteic killer suppression protein